MLKKPVRRRPEIQLTTFVDVLFTLLAFFLVFAALKWAAPTSLGVDLPRTASMESAVRNKQELQIVMNGKGIIRIDGRIVPDGRLAEVLRHRQTERMVTVIWADKKLPYEKVVTLLSIVRMNGGRHVRLAVLPGGS